MSRSSAHPLSWALPVVLGVVGCQSQQPAEPTMTQPAPKASVAAANSPIPSSSAAPAQSHQALNPSELNDDQIAAVVVAMNEGEVHEAEAAEPGASAGEIKSFAAHMKTAHTEMLDSAKGTLSKEHITASSSTVSKKLDDDSLTETTSLKKLHGTELDEAYIKAQVKAHEAAALLVDDLLAGVKNADLKSVLEKEHGQIEEHLSDALRIERTMRPAIASMKPSDAPTKR